MAQPPEHPGARLAWPLRPLLHRALLRGLRAPRLTHDPPIARLAQASLHAARLETLRLRGARGQALAAWLLVPGGPEPARVRSGAERPVAAPESAVAGSEAAAEGPSAPRLPAVLAMHGWGANASTLWPAVDPLLAAGFAVMLLDASCHGESGDEAFTSLPRFAEDIATGMEALCAHPAVDGDRIALLGHSVGAGAALLHASRASRSPFTAPCPVRAVVSLSAFAHPAEMMQRWMAEHRIPRRLLGEAILGHVQEVIGERFERIAPVNTIAALACPVLLVHGRHDATVPMSDALRLRDAQPSAELLLVDADHDLRAALAPLGGAIVAFLEDALGPRPRGPVPAAPEPPPTPLSRGTGQA